MILLNSYCCFCFFSLVIAAEVSSQGRSRSKLYTSLLATARSESHDISARNLSRPTRTMCCSSSLLVSANSARAKSSGAIS